jgi:hypothetical protein
MRTILVILIAAGAMAAIVACGSDSATDTEDPTSLSLEESFVVEADGEFRFTLRLVNEGDVDAVDVVLSDVWQDGLEITDVGDFDGLEATRIADIGVEVILERFGAREAGELVYKAKCVQTGQWANSAVVTSANAPSSSDSVSVQCG